MTGVVNVISRVGLSRLRRLAFFDTRPPRPWETICRARNHERVTGVIEIVDTLSQQNAQVLVTVDRQGVAIAEDPDRSVASRLGPGTAVKVMLGPLQALSGVCRGVTENRLRERALHLLAFPICRPLAKECFLLVAKQIGPDTIGLVGLRQRFRARFEFSVFQYGKTYASVT